MSEPEQSKKINGAFLKFLTGADIVTARNWNSPNYVEYILMFTPTLLCNGIPKIDGGSEDVNGIWRRLKIIDFPVQFSAVGPFDKFRQPIDDSLGKKYCKNRNALLIPEEVYRENNPLLRFLEGSHGTFLHFSLQSSHLSICYYHQDLH
ncbi:hypothetical protein BDK51DRAFT_45829 [Blyttiomyces helicus]|uniref:Uncharacterized protein n=1 Tax=Blyttiomyces helicus TaxID=388810 RepID=A0A4P9WDA3_9FUNG|nr:hypothetical protein BDK51DRAFT_45829 [Blyttiomyces helicus]|eukprot:RKO90514.1 hypothetical protein BDK51DRAFT_45829 [Blyttiomyces helicus]